MEATVDRLVSIKSKLHNVIKIQPSRSADLELSTLQLILGKSLDVLLEGTLSFTTKQIVSYAAEMLQAAAKESG